MSKSMSAENLAKVFGQAHELFLAMEKAGFSSVDYPRIINSKGNVAAKAMFEAYQISVSNNLFGQPLLTKQVTIHQGFSLDTNVVPNEEFAYNYISPEMRDENFDPLTIFGSVTLTIAPTTRNATVEEICNEANQNDALAIICALHNMLVADKHSLDEYKYRSILVPVKSKFFNADVDLFCYLLLYWDGRGCGWHCYWIDDRDNAGICVASLG